MTIQTIESYASQALSCSQQMFLLAEQQEWDALGKLESERNLLLQSLFSHPSLPMMLAKIADTLRYIIEIDQKTISLGKQARNILKNEMDMLKQGKKAVDAYLQNTA
ncbi:MAG: flagellar protein FliT [Gammaproteobacteria bacterium]|nr:flagellar protein FliT [Gammaproteobacteria bacterium]